MIPQTDIYGDKYFQELPEQFKVATIEDFVTEKMYVGKPFLLLSYHSSVYECHRTKEPETLLDKIQPWLDDEHIFVLKTKE